METGKPLWEWARLSQSQFVLRAAREVLGDSGLGGTEMRPGRGFHMRRPQWKA